MEIPNYAHLGYGLDPAFQEFAWRLLHAPLWNRRKLAIRSIQDPIRHLYRYQDFSANAPLSLMKAEDALVESRLYLASAASFNDPYEFQADVALTSDPVKRRQFLERGAKRKGFKGKKFQLAVQDATKRALENPDFMMDIMLMQRDHHGIACFTRDPRNLLMWSYYAAGHTGIAVMYSPANDPGIFLQALPVNYQDTVAKVIWPDHADRIIDDVLIRKSKRWEMEKEVRFISSKIINGHIHLHPPSVSGVILGNRFPDDSMPLLDDLLRRRRFRGYPPVRLFRADRFRDRYQVYLRRLNERELALLPNH